MTAIAEEDADADVDVNVADDCLAFVHVDVVETDSVVVAAAAAVVVASASCHPSSTADCCSSYNDSDYRFAAESLCPTLAALWLTWQHLRVHMQISWANSNVVIATVTVTAAEVAWRDAPVTVAD